MIQDYFATAVCTDVLSNVQFELKEISKKQYCKAFVVIREVRLSDYFELLQFVFVLNVTKRLSV